MKLRSILASGLLAFGLSAAVVCGPLALTGCALFGVPVAQSFEERVVAGYASIATAADTVGVLLDAGKIDAHDARNAHTQLTNLKDGIDVAVAIRKTGDFSNAETRLDATIGALDLLRDYLNQRAKP